MESQVITLAGLTTILGIILPPFLALVKKTGWKKRSKDLVILAILIVVGAVAGFLAGEINPMACSDAELPECLTLVVGYIGFTAGQALVWYKLYWEDSALENKIAGTTPK